MRPLISELDEAAGRLLLAQALATETPEELDDLWAAVGEHAGHSRPVGDRWGNRGLFTAAGGNFDHKLTELITNMHDALLTRAVVERWGPSIFDTATFGTLFSSPRDAVVSMYAELSFEQRARQATVELRSAGADRKRERTVVFRDFGIGMSPDEIANSLFKVGSSRKDGVLWQLGAFGRGGLTVLPNCAGLVVVSRSMLEPQSVVVSAVRWERIGNRQTETALYQVTSPWESDRDRATVLVLPPALATEFDFGTHVAVVGFRAEGIWVSRLGDEHSIDTMIDTRMYDPVMPLTLSTPALGERGLRSTRLRGLRNRLRENPRTDRAEGEDTLPFRVDGTTYRLPVHFALFAAGDVGARRRFVAHDHALLLISNGQVHAHWTPAEFRHRTRLTKLADRILVVLDTDPLPLNLRTSLFTADRTELLRHPQAVRLESELIAFLNEWDDLWQANSDMIRDSIRRSNGERSTTALAQRIARAVNVRTTAAMRQPTEHERTRRPAPPRELLDDPTALVAPAELTVTRGQTHGLHVALNARDRFVPARTTCTVTTNHLDIDPLTDITVGELKRGRLRISIAVPSDAELTTAEIRVSIDGWLSAQGGLREALQSVVQLNVVDPSAEAVAGRRSTPRAGDVASTAAAVAMIWTSHEAEPQWSATTVGEVERVPADALVILGPDYAHLVGRDDEIPFIKLNEEFAPLKAYSAMRARSVGDEGVARAKDRYALGVAVEMLLADAEVRDRRQRGELISDNLMASFAVAAARGVLAVLPDFDSLTAEIGIDDI